MRLTIANKGKNQKKLRALAFCLLLMPLASNSGCKRSEGQRDLCNCGPDTCLKDPRYPPKLAKKKADMKEKRFPDELISLLDRDGQCVMAIDQAPDTFRILLVAKNGDNNSREWTQKDEEIANKDLLNGILKAYYKYNVRKVFACCEERKAEERDDWDKELNLSRNLSIFCSKQGSAVVCK